MVFSPLTIKSITLKNRLVVSPMCQYSYEDGFSNDWQLVHLGTRAVGGFGLIIQEATAVSPEGRISSGDLGIWKDEHIDELREVVSFLALHGAVAGIQLAHAGRKASFQIPWHGNKQVKIKDGGYSAVAPSAIPFYEGDESPAALTVDGIRKVVNDFRAAAARAVKAGFKVMEIHAAHGYLIHQFLSPLSNHRTDGYGGSFENRIRVLVEIISAVKEVWPADLPLFIRISATDWADGGWNENEAARLASIVKALGVDLIDCSSGGLVPHQKIPVGPGYQVPFAEKLKTETGVLTGAVGLITSIAQAEEILTSGKADLIFMAREALRNPYLPLVSHDILGQDVAWPQQYVRAKS